MTPPRPNPSTTDPLIDRPRLVDALDRIAQRPLAVIKGPPGSGKSVLLDQWIERFDGGDVVRVEIVGPDVDRVRRDIVDALRVLEADPTDPGTNVVPGSFAESDDLDRELAALADARVATGRPVWIVIDDQGGHLHVGHLANFESTINRPPPGLHIVVATSRSLNVPRGAIETMGRIERIGRDELAFDVDEVRELAARVCPDVDSDLAAALHAETDGWVAPVVAALAALASKDLDRDVALDRARRAIDDFVVAEVLDPLPEDLRVFLGDVVGLGDLDPAMCDAILGRDDSVTMIEELRDQLALLQPIDGTVHSYRAHPLLARTLDRRSDQLRGAVRSREVAEAAAAWFASRNDLARSIEQLVTAGDWEGTVSVASDNAAALTVRADLRQALDVMAAIPESVIRANPRGFQTLVTFQIAAGNLTQASVLLTDYQANLRTDPVERWIDETFVHGAWAAMGPWGLESASTLAHAEAALELMAHRPTEAGVSLGGGTPNWSRTVVLLAGGRALFDLDRWDEAVDWLDRAGKNPGRPHQVVRAFATRGWIEAHQGNLDAAETSAARAEWIARGLTGPADWMIEVYLLRGMLAWMRGDLAGVETNLDRARTNRAPRRPTEIEARLTILQAAVELARGRYRRGLTVFDTWRSAGYPASTWETEASMVAGEVRLAVAYGQLDYARRLLASSPTGRDLPAAHALVARVGGDRRGLAVLLDTWRRSPSIVNAIEYRLFRALQADDLGNPDHRRRHLLAAAGAARPGGLVPVFVDHAPGSVDLLRDELDRCPDPLLAETVERIESCTGTARVALEALFSPREADVIELLATHLDAAAIADRLAISVSTLKSHQRRIYRKLKVNRRSDAVARVIELGLLRPGGHDPGGRRPGAVRDRRP